MNIRKIKRHLTELYYVGVVLTPYVVWSLAIIGLVSLISL